MVYLTVLFAEQEKPVIAVSNYPLQWVVETLVGDHAKVINLSKDLENPRVWVPDDEGLEILKKAKLIVLQGGGYEIWAEDVEIPRGFDSTKAVTALFQAKRKVPHDNLERFYYLIEGRAWLDPLHFQLQVDAIRDELGQRLPELGTQVQWEILKKKMSGIEKRFESTERLKKVRILTFEPVWEYTWGSAYGWMVKSPSLQEEPGIPQLSDQVLEKLDTTILSFPARMSISSQGTLPKAWRKRLQLRYNIWSVELNTAETQPPNGKDFETVMIENHKKLTAGFAK